MVIRTGTIHRLSQKWTQVMATKNSHTVTTPKR